MSATIALHAGSLEHAETASTREPAWVRVVLISIALTFFAVFLLLPAVSFVAADARYKEFTRQAQAVQLAGNGHWEFWHAFRHNEIDYEQFYRTETLAKAYQILRHEFERTASRLIEMQSQEYLQREHRP